MKRSTLFVVVSLVSLFITAMQAQQQEFVTINFSTGLYPATPMKNVQSLTMKLWGHVDAAYLHPEMRDMFLGQQELFAKQVATLHSLIDILLLALSEQYHECDQCVVQAIHDFEHIYNGIVVINNRYRQLTQSNPTHYTHAVVYLLDTMQKKLGYVIQTGTINSSLHSYFLHHSRLTIPLLPPATIFPVAPIA